MKMKLLIKHGTSIRQLIVKITFNTDNKRDFDLEPMNLIKYRFQKIDFNSYHKDNCYFRNTMTFQTKTRLFKFVDEFQSNTK